MNFEVILDFYLEVEYCGIFMYVLIFLEVDI